MHTRTLCLIEHGQHLDVVIFRLRQNSDVDVSCTLGTVCQAQKLMFLPPSSIVLDAWEQFSVFALGSSTQHGGVRHGFGDRVASLVSLPLSPNISGCVRLSLPLSLCFRSIVSQHWWLCSFHLPRSFVGSQLLVISASL